MKILPPEIEIPHNDPFKNDLLDRKQYAESLMRLVESAEENLVISIDAQWGKGKTTFIKMWQALLESNKIKTIYFDSFTHDYFQDPFISVVGEISEKYKSIPKADKRKIAKFNGLASKIGVQLLSTGLRIGVSALTAKVNWRYWAKAVTLGGEKSNRVLTSFNSVSTRALIHY